jgi:hypothetical protein
MIFEFDNSVWEVKVVPNTPIFQIYKDDVLLIQFPTRVEFWDFINFLRSSI